jgi:hypothetical protein
MNKLIILMFLFSMGFGNQIHAYYGNNAATKYYNGEISTDEYLDSCGVPSGRTQETTIYHSDGSKSLIRTGSSGQGTIIHSNGSKSIYQTSPY